MVGVVTFYRQYGGVSKVLWLFAIDNYDYYYNKNSNIKTFYNKTIVVLY